MYPVSLERSKLPPAFNQLIDPAPVLLFSDTEIAENRRRWIDEWLEVMAH
jgi:thiamine transport system substrate-binding protein